MKKLLHLLVLLIAVTTGATAILAGLIHTAGGTRALVSLFITVTGMPLEINEIQGRLSDRVSFSGVRYRDRYMDIAMDRLAVDWSTEELLRLKLEVSRIDAGKVLIKPIAGEEGERAFTVPAFAPPSVPLKIRIRDMHLAEVQYAVADKTYLFESVSATLAIDDDDALSIDAFQLRSGPHLLDGKLKLLNGAQPEIIFSANWSGELLDSSAGGSLYLAGTREHLALKTSFQGPVTGHAGGILHLNDGMPRGEISGEIHGKLPEFISGHLVLTAPASFNLAADGGMISAGLEAPVERTDDGEFTLRAKAGTPFPETLSLPGSSVRLDWEVLPADRASGFPDIRGGGNLEYANGILNLDQKLLAPYGLGIKGNIDWSGSTTGIHLALDWNDLQLPIAKLEHLRSPTGQLYLEGTPDRLAIRLDGQFEERTAGAVNVNANAVWADQVLTLDRSEFSLLGGELAANGAVDFRDIVHGDIRLEGAGLDFSRINPDLTSNLAFSSMVHFDMPGTGPSVSAEIRSLSGHWRGYALTGSARVSHHPDLDAIEELRLQTGDNRLVMRLSKGQQLAGRIELQLNDLSVLASGLDGRLEGNVDLSGTIDSPQFAGKLAGSDLSIAGLNIKSVEAVATVDAADDFNSSLTIRSADFNYADWSFQEVLVNGTGRPERHELEMTASGKKLDIRVALAGGWSRPSWRGELIGLEVNTEIAGPWKLEKTAELGWDEQAQSLHVSMTCLAQAENRICLQVSAAEGGKHVGEIQLARLSFDPFRPWFPEAVSLDGFMSGRAYLVLINKDDWNLQAEVSADDVKAVFASESEVEALDINKIVLKAEADPDSGKIDLALHAPHVIDIALTGSMERTGKQQVQASLDMRLLDIEWLTGVEPDLTGSHGQFLSTVRVTGSVNKPVIRGDFKLLEGQIYVVPLGLGLDEITGDLSADQATGRVNITSRLGSDGKHISINGYFSPEPGNNYPYSFRVSGDHFPLVNTTDIAMSVSPALDWYGTTHLHYLRGRLDVPTLVVREATLPESAVSVSEDTVVVGADQPEASARKGAFRDFVRNRLDVDVHITAGPDIHIQGYGLDARFSGDINLLKPGGTSQPKGEGQVVLSEGSYQSYGQNLKIEEGKLLFAGPLENPGINVRAVRPNLPVTAGVKISGTVREPVVALYSDPSLPDGDILAYLMTGRPLAGASTGEASLIAQAAVLSLGAQESSVVTRQIGAMFNLDEFTVNSGSTVESTSLSATKILSNRLTFRSSFNPFDQFWTVILNFKLTDHWSVQTESGISQAADVIYSIQSDRFSDLFSRLWKFF